MKKEKLSLKSIKNVLTREEMKKIMAGSGNCSTSICNNDTIFCCTNFICTDIGECFAR